MLQRRYRVIEVANRLDKDSGGIGAQAITFQKIFGDLDMHLDIDQIGVVFTIMLLGDEMNRYTLGQIVTLSLE